MFLQENIPTIALIALIIYALIATNIQIKNNKLEIAIEIEKAVNESSKQIERSISPRVVYWASIDQVRTEAAQIISEAAVEFATAAAENAKLIVEGSEERRDISQYFVTIYGAASLFNESEAGQKLDAADRKLSISRYNEATELAAKHKLQFRRYVSLIGGSELSTRSVGVQNEYIEWLIQQQKALARDANYTIIVSPRAPHWGSSNSSIIGNPGIVEVKGHGNSAFAIYDRRISIDLRSNKSFNEKLPEALIFAAPLMPTPPPSPRVVRPVLGLNVVGPQFALAVFSTSDSSILVTPLLVGASTLVNSLSSQQCTGIMGRKPSRLRMGCRNSKTFLTTQAALVS
jgi:hypothetical protein